MSNPRVRFALGSALIVAAAVGAGLAHLGSARIAAVVGVAWALLALVEYRVSRRSRD